MTISVVCPGASQCKHDTCDHAEVHEQTDCCITATSCQALSSKLGHTVKLQPCRITDSALDYALGVIKYEKSGVR